MTTVGRLAKRHGISRSTLLYYHRVGLLIPGGHRQGDYRHYTAADEARLERILLLRDAGLSLADIDAVLADAKSRFAETLERRLRQTSVEIEALKAQQRLTATLLGRYRSGIPDGSMTKERWEAMLVDAGFTEADMYRWHREFEATDAKGHRAFLHSLNLSENEVRRIRCWAGRVPAEKK